MFSKTDSKIKIIALMIALLTVIIYLPVLQNDFVNWDDPAYIYENPNIRSINLQSVRWMFTAFYEGNWHPLTWFSHAVDYAIWGLNPLGHHLLSIILHGLNTFLVIILVFRLVRHARKQNQETSADSEYTDVALLIPAAVTGLLFGVHPLHVESVAWASERKDLLYAFFFLLSILFYLRYASSPSFEKGQHGYGLRITRYRQYGLSLLLFILALLSKPMAITMPFVLIILDIYPLERLNIKSAFTSQRMVLTEKIPFFILSIMASVVTITAQAASKAIVPVWVHSPGNRIFVAMKALCYYLLKMIWPTKLVPLYPFPIRFTLNAEYVGSLLLVIGITVVCILLWRSNKKVYSAVWLYYIVTLFPVLGIVQVGGHEVASRYVYLPIIGPFLLTGLGTAQVWEKAGRKLHATVKHKLFFIMPLLIVFIFLSYLTIKQEKVWRSSLNLWTFELLHFNNLHTVYDNRAMAYIKSGNYKKALEDFKKSKEINPKYPITHYRIGLVYEQLGSNLQAMRSYVDAIRLYPDFQLAKLQKKIAYDEIIEVMKEQISSNPKNAALYVNRGAAHAMMNRFQEAIEDFDRALYLRPDALVVYYNRGLVYIETGRYQDAVSDLDTLIKFNPQDAQAYYNRGIAYEKLGDWESAARDLKTAAGLGDKKAQQYLISKGINW